jgi:hypothetical protein
VRTSPEDSRDLFARSCGHNDRSSIAAKTIANRVKHPAADAMNLDRLAETRAGPE